MKPSRLRLAALVETVEREITHLLQTDQRLFDRPFDRARVEGLLIDSDESERVDAFVARFGRLQDTVGDKLLPEYLRALEESVGSALDNLDRLEKWGFLESVETWVTARRLRNRMIHDYVTDSAELAEAINEGHSLVPAIVRTAQAIVQDVKNRKIV